MKQNCAHQLYCFTCHLEFLSWTKVRLHGATDLPTRETRIAAGEADTQSALAKGVLVNDKTNMRYNGFRSTDEGGRIFEFSFSGASKVAFLICIEIPRAFFEGVNRIQLQEGVAISCAKLKHLLSVGTADEIPRSFSLTAFDLAQYRHVPAESKRRWGYGADRAGKTPV